MNPDVKALWLEALEDPEAKQVRNTLSRIDHITQEIKGHCCLGVLCQVALRANVVACEQDIIPSIPGVRESATPTNELAYFLPNHPHRHRNTMQLPELVKDWAGVETQDPVIPIWSPRPGIPVGSYTPEDHIVLHRVEDSIQDRGEDYDLEPSLSLAEMNDAGFTFAQIADVIRHFL
jgi:hypothetical protein